MSSQETQPICFLRFNMAMMIYRWLGERGLNLCKCTIMPYLCAMRRSCRKIGVNRCIQRTLESWILPKTGLVLPVFKNMSTNERYYRWDITPISSLPYTSFYPRPILAFGYCRCLRLCVYVCLCVNHEFVRAITLYPFKLESPNLEHKCKTPWLRTLLFCGVIDHDLQGQI